MKNHQQQQKKEFLFHFYSEMLSIKIQFQNIHSILKNLDFPAHISINIEQKSKIFEIN